MIFLKQKMLSFSEDNYQDSPHSPIGRLQSSACSSETDHPITVSARNVANFRPQSLVIFTSFNNGNGWRSSSSTPKQMGKCMAGSLAIESSCCTYMALIGTYDGGHQVDTVCMTVYPENLFITASLSKFARFSIHHLDTKNCRCNECGTATES